MDDIIQRIRALRARAEDPASSVSEAEAAAARATKLIIEHDLSETDLRERADNLEAVDRYASNRKSTHSALEMCMGSIATLTGTRSLRYTTKDAQFIGLEADVEFAIYLCEVIRSASERAWKQDRTPYMGQKDRRSYLRGFGIEMRPKLEALAEERRASTGTELVVVKDEIIERHEDIKRSRPASNRKLKVTETFNDGRAAGSRFDLRRPIGANQTAGRIR